MAGVVSISVVAGQYSCSGFCDNRGLRISDLLNEPSTEFLQISDATLRQHLMGQPLANLANVTIPKVSIDFVVLKGKHEAPLRRQNALVQKRPYRACVVIRDYEIHGRLMLKGTSVPVAAISQELSAFFPLAAACLSFLGQPQKGDAEAVTLINKSKVSFFHIGPAEPSS